MELFKNQFIFLKKLSCFKKNHKTFITKKIEITANKQQQT